jgi:hypothetical protein
MRLASGLFCNAAVDVQDVFLLELGRVLKIVEICVKSFGKIILG